MTAPVSGAVLGPEPSVMAGTARARLRHTARRRWRVWVARPASALIALAIWEWSSGRVVDAFFVSRPSRIFAQLWEWVSTGEIFFHLWVTLQELLIGFVIGAVLGIVGGLAIGLMPFVSDVIRPFIISIHAVPSIALMPLFIIWFGLGMLPKVVMAMISVSFFVFLTTFSGVVNVDRELINVVKVMGGRQRDLIQRVILPATTGWVFAGLRISVPAAFTGAVAGELLAGNKGIGSLISASAGAFNTAGVFAGVLSLVIFAWVMSIGLDMVETKMGRWTAASEVTKI